MGTISPYTSYALEAVEPRLAARGGLSLEESLGSVAERQTTRVGLELFGAVESLMTSGAMFGRQMSEVRLSVGGKSGERQFMTIREFKEGGGNVLLHSGILSRGILQVGLVARGLLTESIV
ncbi:MAG TPA: hypothetical protein VMX35_05005 [Acidobacteriota bacterium]|nr:hypothetical protein [Acidobacteriota bacterium]